MVPGLGPKQITSTIVNPLMPSKQQCGAGGPATKHRKFPSSNNKFLSSVEY